MSNEIKKIPFENGELLGVKTEDGRVWLGVKKACLDIGLSEIQARSQVEKMQEDLVLKSNYRKFPMVQTEGTRQVEREVTCISEECVTLWFAKITLTPAMQQQNPEAVKKLISYQLKAQKVLHEAFMGTEEKKQEFYDGLGIHGEIVDIKEEITGLKDETMNLKEEVKQLINNTTINSRQAQKLLFAAKARVSTMLGGAHSFAYKEKSRLYFKNLWLDLCERYEVNTYKDLNPIHMDGALDFIGHWSYVE